MKVFIFNRDERESKELSDIIKEIKSVSQIRRSECCDATICHLGENFYDVVFVDVLPDDEEVLRMLNILNTNYKKPIIIVTSADYHGFKRAAGYAVDYIAKPFSREDIHASLNKAADIFTDYQFSVFFDGNEHVLHYGEIEFLEAKLHNLIIHTRSNQEYMVRESISSFVGKHNLPFLVRCHKSFFVNIYYVQTVEDNAILMRSENRVPLSRKYRKESFYPVFNQIVDRY